MIQLFIFNELSRASIYGIGTYIGQLISFLDTDYKINVVNFYSDKPEFTVIERTTCIRELYIPQNQLQYEDGKCFESYYLNSVYLLSDYIDKGSKVIFHFNHFRYASMLRMLKEYWPLCKIVLTVNYLSWGFTLQGNVDYFKSIIHCNQKESLNPLEHDILNDYEKETAFLKEVDNIICLSRFTRNLLFAEYHIPEHKLTLVLNGIEDEAEFLPPEEKILLKQKLHFRPEDKIFLFVGRLDNAKGIEFLIASFKKLLTLRDDCRLVIVGDGNFSKLLHDSNGYWNRILFTGKLSKKELYQFYQIADAGVLLSKHEQCSYVIIEMMMHALPIIASSSIGVDEMVTDGLNGFKINTIYNKSEASFDTDNCCHLLDKVISLDLSKKNEMEAASRKAFKEHYSLNQMREKMLSVYKSL